MWHGLWLVASVMMGLGGILWQEAASLAFAGLLLAAVSGWWEASRQRRRCQQVARQVGDLENTLVQIQETKSRFLTLAEMAPVGMFFTNGEGLLLYVNQRWAVFLGVRPEQAMGKPWTCCLRDEDRSFILSEWQRASREGVPFRFEYCFFPPGSVGEGAWGLCETVAQRDGEGRVVGAVGTLTDITDRKQAEWDIALLAAAIEHAADMVSIIDRNGRFLYANPAFYNLTGYAPGDLVGQSVRDLDSSLSNTARSEDMWREITAGHVWKGHMVQHRKDGSAYETVTSVSPIQGGDGEIVNFVIVSRDVTREVRLEQQLRQSQKLEAIGTLAGGIAHDFNNLLTPVIGFTEMALEDLPEDSLLHRNLRMVMEAGMRAKDLVAQILAFGRCHEQDPKPLQPMPIIKECLKLLRAAVPATIRIVSRLDPGCGLILADPSRVHQVVMNLCTNAVQAMGEAGGILDVGLAKREMQATGDVAGGLMLVLTVRDTGCGMTPEVMERIFDPFFTTKEAGGGTGLGLSVVHGIVRSLKGVVEVESRVGAGTTFRVMLPEIKGQESVSHTGDRHMPRGRERIFLVDDEPMLLELGKQILERLGYEIITFSDPQMALDQYARDPESVDLVITDQTMPNLTGDALTRRMLTLRPGLPVILCTGFSEMVNEERAREAGVRLFMMKPIAPMALAKAVREILDVKT